MYTIIVDKYSFLQHSCDTCWQKRIVPDGVERLALAVLDLPTPSYISRRSGVAAHPHSEVTRESWRYARESGGQTRPVQGDRKTRDRGGWARRKKENGLV